jgi:hypothetical protein
LGCSSAAKIPGNLEDYRNTKPYNNKPLYPDIQKLSVIFYKGFIMLYWEKMVWYIWGYDGLIIGWFEIKDGLIDTPKTFSDFLEKVLNVLLTKLKYSGIMQKWHATKWIPSQEPRIHFIVILLKTFCHT